MSLKYSDIDPKVDFADSSLLVGSLWNFPSLDKADGLHSNNYHGQFVPQIPRQLMKRYTKKGDLVLDMFLGSGTTMLEAIRMNRDCIGVDLRADLWPGICDKVGERSSTYPKPLPRGHFLHGDSASVDVYVELQQIVRRFNRQHVQLAILHPPYHDIVRFSEDRRDLSCQPTIDDFLECFISVAFNAMNLLEPGRFAALVIGDIYQGASVHPSGIGQVYPLGFVCAEKMMIAGGILKSVIVKNIAGNERGKGKNGNLWRYRALAGGFSIFEHEYIFIFQKRKEKRAGSKKAKSDQGGNAGNPAIP